MFGGSPDTWRPIGLPARASVQDQMTRFTFTQPVEIPGETLPAGTYWFQLLDSPSNRDMVLIHDQTRLCTTVLTASAWRCDPGSSISWVVSRSRYFCSWPG
jgi:hypothetical protein